jgi:ABC-type sugar transport system ATPase subunit
MTLLKVSGISKQGEGDFALKKITFVQRKYQKIVIAGETGSGKSTLLKIIAGLAQPDEGEVVFDNERVKGPAEKLVPGHPAIAYLSQHFELAQFLSVEQVLSYANNLREGEAEKLFEICQISHLLTRKTDQLSGGERQRIAIARLLLSSPALLLLDEPFSNLDRVHQNTLETVIRSISKKLKITCILVSHEPQETLSWADTILVMRDGKMLQQGKPEEIYRHPVDVYTAGLFGKYNLLTPSQAKVFFKTAIKSEAGRLLVRPENFRLAGKGKKGVKGKVTGIHFFGSFYEIEVLLKKLTIVIQTTTQYTEGDTVFVSLSKGSAGLVV